MILFFCQEKKAECDTSGKQKLSKNLLFPNTGLN